VQWNLVVYLCLAVQTLEAQPYSQPMLGVLGFKACQLAGLWVWSFSCGGLRMKFPCTHFQEILNQSLMKFSVAYFVTVG